jgi:hypothetical protein
MKTLYDKKNYAQKETGLNINTNRYNERKVCFVLLSVGS